MAQELANEILAHLDLHLNQAPIFLSVCSRLEVSTPIENGRTIFLVIYPDPNNNYEKAIKYDIKNIEGVAQIMYSAMHGCVDEPTIHLCDNTSGHHQTFDEPVLGVWTIKEAEMDAVIPKLVSILKTLLDVIF